MSCPHVSGVVALLKSTHPHWSPVAIRSALLTTAYNVDIYGDDIAIEASEKSADPFDIGLGHINPLKALDPGLVYDATMTDYVHFLCNMGYSEAQIQAMHICPLLIIMCPDKPEPNWNINYPSITVWDLRYATTVKRSVRNVGHSKTGVYYVSVVKPHGLEVVVWPKVLVFSPFKEEITYHVTMSPLKISQGRYDFGSIMWSDGFHHVRSPLVVQVNTNAPLTATIVNASNSLSDI
ncbi:subtilisin-like protease SBT3.18 [Salvia miltiorrhiza]|uniref:subtilisin-like protease SBT3.18 n=1 Tax=Salvia miltiorrhiza TaxID=226208 RepID=UPI0025AD63C7|nr:subtilisin-like protease SBT3.18 [Salvia miltiorrhiza]